MIIVKNLVEAIVLLGFKESTQGGDIYKKYFIQFDCELSVDFLKRQLIYPENKGLKINDKTTCNFGHPENFVVFECICRLLEKGYRPEHLELEKRWNLGHNAKGGKADICVYDKDGINMLCIIECKTSGNEYIKELKAVKNDGGQLFSYWQQERSTKWLLLYASTISNSKISYTTESINCSDDANILELSKKDTSIKVYKNSHSVGELYDSWSDTYEKALFGDIVFGEDTQSYNIGIKPLRKKDLIDFSQNDKIVNKFEEILRHNNVSDKENAFNRLIALFICKLVDEINKSPDEVVEFQYKNGTDTYESLQDRLQRLHQQGMDEFMKEKIFYVADDYAENLVKSYTGQKRANMIADLKNTLRILKFYTNNDFAFKDVHNEDLFYQNGKVLVEVVQLFEKYRIIESNSLQLLGDLFEQLLNKGFKQNEGQFFTPIPITRFIWDSLPLEELIYKSDKINYPKIIDYACGAGHFLTEGFEAIRDVISSRIGNDIADNNLWVEKKLYGIEKDYRLARVSKISLFMHGAGNGNIIFGDGLENYPEKNITPADFDILVANPPYSVSAFKPHLNLKNNSFELVNVISNDGSEIETLFVERLAQLIKPNGIAAVVLPSSILNKESNSFIGARESILKNFYIRSIVQFGSKTFGATGTNTIVLFLEKFEEPPKRIDLVDDSINSIFFSNDISDWEDKEILREYLLHIGVERELYNKFIKRELKYSDWSSNEYFNKYVEAFETSVEYVAKNKQKLFEKLTDEDKQDWFDKKFYDFSQVMEQEKMQYFGLVYKQNTLIVSAPDENKEQEKFLGYKWSNRKGSEGIQIINAGGMLYDENNRNAQTKLANVVKNSFCDKAIDVSELSDYYYYLRLQDMLDFKNVSFNKSLKITRTREKRSNANLVTYNLSDKIFDVSIGDRVLASEIVENGTTPVYSANVFEIFGHINKQKLTDFSLASIIWGIDGDWMVNCIPAGVPFYPTDHCGVIRVNSENIVPKYLALALQVEGEYEKFSRSNRASTQRIKNLSIQIPNKDTQIEVVNLIENIDKQISNEKAIIDSLSEDVKSKFVAMFGDKTFDKNMKNAILGNSCLINPEKDDLNELDDNSLVSFVSMSSVSEKGYVDTSNLKEYSTVKKGYTFFKNHDVLLAKITPCMENGKRGIVLNLNNNIGFGSTEFHVLRPINNISNSYWLNAIISFEEFRKEAAENMTGSSGHRRVPEGFLENFPVLLPSISLQNKFATYVEETDKLKFV